jgi:hypothetical protein
MGAKTPPPLWIPYSRVNKLALNINCPSNNKKTLGLKIYDSCDVNLFYIELMYG